MRTILSLFLFAMQAAQPQTPISRTTISGTVTRAGSNDPIADAQVTLTLGFPADGVSAMISGAAKYGVQASTFQTISAQLLTMSPQEMQTAIGQMKAAGLAPEMAAGLDRMLAAIRSNPDLPIKTVSDANGRFTIRDVPPGRYGLIVQREGYFGVSPNGSVQLPQTSIQGLTIPEQATPQTVTASLVPGAVIAGRVRAPNGRPANNVAVQAFIVEYRERNGQPSLTPVAEKQTDDRGEFRMAWLQPGAYYVAAIPQKSVIAAAANAKPQEIAVRTFYPDVIDATRAVPISVNAGQDIGGIDIPLRTALPARVSGKIVSTLGLGDTSAASSALLLLTQRDDIVSGNIRLAATITLTPTSGAFELRDILPGTYELFSRIQNSPGNEWGLTSFEVRERDVTGVNLTVHPNVDVRGKVSVDGKAPAANNTIRVGLMADGPAALIGSYQSVAGRQQTPSADGSFTVPGIAEGTYRVFLNGASPDSYVADVRQSGMSIYDAVLNVTDKTPEPLEVMVRSDGGSVDGTLTSADAKPASRTLIALVPAASQRSNPARYRTTISDLQGHFAIRGVPPGSYKAFAWENLPDGAYLNPDFVKTHENEGVAIEVAPGRAFTTTVRVIDNK